MRVNHSGEVSAQALYRGQALVARDPGLKRDLLSAADEEGRHLKWCAERISELKRAPQPADTRLVCRFLGIGALAGLMGDRASLGFLAETEAQVESHLDGLWMNCLLTMRAAVKFSSRCAPTRFAMDAMPNRPAASRCRKPRAPPCASYRR